MDLWKLGIAGAAAYLYFGRGSSDDEIISATDAAPDDLNLTQGEIIATSGDGTEVAIAIPDDEIGDSVEIPNEVTGETETYVKTGEGIVDQQANGDATYIPTEETAMNGTFFSSETFLGREREPASGMGASIYANPSPLLWNPLNSKGNPKSRDLRRRFAVIGRRLPTHDKCARAGKTVARWRWGKHNGKHTQDATPTQAVSNSAAILASTPCEVFSKVSRGAMTGGAAERRLRGYYSGHKDTEGLEHIVNAWK